ncbi:MAG: hypothetical protein R2697_05305 [Ilumatobacteraceae bacterium]
MAAGIAVGVTAIFAGIANRKATCTPRTEHRRPRLRAVHPAQTLFDESGMGWWWTLLLLVVALVRELPGRHRLGQLRQGLSARVSMLIQRFLVALVIFVGRHLQSWQGTRA